MSPAVYSDYVLARTFVSHTLERAKYVFNGPITSAFQGDQPLGDHGYARNVIQDPRAKCGVPEDGPASKDENYSSGKGKGKNKEDIKSESKLTKNVG